MSTVLMRVLEGKTPQQLRSLQRRWQHRSLGGPAWRGERTFECWRAASIIAKIRLDELEWMKEFDRQATRPRRQKVARVEHTAERPICPACGRSDTPEVDYRARSSCYVTCGWCGLRLSCGHGTDTTPERMMEEWRALGEAGARRERERVVALLEREAAQCHTTWTPRLALHMMADAIRAGRHWEE